MMNLKSYVENHGRKIITIFVLIDPKREVKEDIVFVMKAEKRIYKQYLRRKLFDYVFKSFKCYIQ